MPPPDRAPIAGSLLSHNFARPASTASAHCAHNSLRPLPATSAVSAAAAGRAGGSARRRQAAADAGQCRRQHLHRGAGGAIMRLVACGSWGRRRAPVSWGGRRFVSPGEEADASGRGQEAPLTWRVQALPWSPVIRCALTSLHTFKSFIPLVPACAAAAAAGAGPQGHPRAGTGSALGPRGAGGADAGGGRYRLRRRPGEREAGLEVSRNAGCETLGCLGLFVTTLSYGIVLGHAQDTLVVCVW